MTEEQQRIAIAEACGWRVYHEFYDDVEQRTVTHWHPPASECDETLVTETLPDYLNDLNAMHETEKVLTEDQHTQLSIILARKLGILEEHGFPCILPGNARMFLRATATQRAEAFLRTLNLWKE